MTVEEIQFFLNLAKRNRKELWENHKSKLIFDKIPNVKKRPAHFQKMSRNSFSKTLIK